ncbi:DUF6233 domain-containing protein [Streptomyces sp. NPDC002994]|uniref:DUF6233 domain-containing protein n=1 Tax=Streptomyces sp. NPDC002994 TaxID=3154441 RepID=UPI0033B46CED
MSDLPPDLPRLRTLEHWHAVQLDRIRAAITTAQQREAEEQRKRPLPPPPDWVLQQGIGQGGPPLAVHVGGCTLAGGRPRPISREQALRALAEGIEACQVCRPDTDLGWLG